MPHIELTAINKKIEQTRTEIENLASCTDDNLRAIMTLQLETRLEALLQEKEAMQTAKDTITLRIYGDNVQRGKISNRVLVSALGGFQSMLDSVANAMIHSPTSRGKIPEKIKDITAFEIVGTFAGSFGIVLEKQAVQSGFASGDEELNNVLSEMFSVLETVDNSEQLLSVITPFGKRTVTHYREWIDSLRACDVNLELNWKNDSASSRKMDLIKDNAPNIISTLDTIAKIVNEDIVINGVLNGVNIRNRSFEMSVEGYGLVKGHALPETLMSIVDKIGKEISVSLTKSISHTKAGVEKISWYLSSIN